MLPWYPAGELKLRFTADDKITDLYINGERTDFVESLWREEKSVSLATLIRVIAVKAYNAFEDKSDKAAILASIRTRSGKDLVVTDSSWKYSTVLETGWETLNFEESGNRKGAAKKAKHGEGVWGWKG